ncbi:MAG: hypothetical protein WDZ74_01825 [Candidatus Paceibacterota bacterium]
MFEFITLKIVYVTLHVFGVAIGAGAAYMNDIIFMSSMKDRVLSSVEIRILSLLSKVVWFGLGLLVVSGILLFLLDPVTYSVSTKFLAKMTIVAVLLINGVVFHRAHLPLLKSIENKVLTNYSRFQKGSSLLVVSGAISIVSWSFAILFGVLRVIPYSYVTIMSVYVGVMCVAIGVALIVRKKFLARARV